MFIYLCVRTWTLRIRVFLGCLPSGPPSPVSRTRNLKKVPYGFDDRRTGNWGKCFLAFSHNQRKLFVCGRVLVWHLLWWLDGGWPTESSQPPYANYSSEKWIGKRKTQKAFLLSIKSFQKNCPRSLQFYRHSTVTELEIARPTAIGAKSVEQEVKPR